jgi:hypothetical protein
VSADLTWFLLPVVAFGLLLFVLMVLRPKLWIGLVFLTLPFFLADIGKGFSASELAVGGFLLLTVVVWFIWQLAASREPIIRTWLDYLVVMFLVLLPTNAVVAMMNSADPIGWTAEWSLYLLILYYFPIRHYYSDEPGVRQLLTIAGISATLQALYSMWLFKQRVSMGLVYAYQIFLSRSVLLGPVFVLALLIGLYALARVRPRFIPVIVAFCAIQAAALLMTFGRTVWAFFLVGVLVLYVIGKNRDRISIAVTLGSISALTVISVLSYNPRIGEIALRLVAQRFTTTTQLRGGDYSMETRIVEADAAMAKFLENPLGGQGMRVPFSSYAPLDKFTMKKSFVHYGYVSLLYKMGIPLTMLMLAILIVFSAMLIKGTWLLLRDPASSPAMLVLAVPAMASLPSLYGNILMAGWFDQRYGHFMFAYLFACAAILHEYHRRR